MSAKMAEEFSAKSLGFEEVKGFGRGPQSSNLIRVSDLLDILLET